MAGEVALKDTMRGDTLRGRRVQVVGAGVSGLVAALLAARAGAEVQVIEETDQVGGLLAPQLFRGVSCDLGSHRLHREALDRPVVREMFSTLDLRRRPRRGVLLLGGRRIAYPPSTLDVMRGLGSDGWGWFFAYLTRGERLRGWERSRIPRIPERDEDCGFEGFVRSRVGAAAYRGFYQPYVEKVWGLEAQQLSQTVAKARVSTTSPWKLVGGAWVNALARARGIPRRFDEFLYPEGGLSSFIKVLQAALAAEGVAMNRNTAFDVATRTRFDHVLYSGRLGQLHSATTREAPAHAFEHRGVYLVYLAIPVDRVGAYETYYAPEAQYWFGRVSELQNYSPLLRCPGETILCVEIPEGRWGRAMRFDDPNTLRELLRQLHHAQIVPATLTPTAVLQRFVPHVYPLYRRGWTRTWDAALTEVETLGNVLPFGRQGLFLHCNIDHCISMASEAVGHLASNGSHAEFRTMARRHVGVRVRD
ncbi:MAG: NAD(P)/FAD-dependent oxidoreductase [Polyangiales bacterium]